MSIARTPENFPNMKVRGGRRRNGQRSTQFDPDAYREAAEYIAEMAARVTAASTTMTAGLAGMVATMKTLAQKWSNR